MADNREILITIKQDTSEQQDVSASTDVSSSVSTDNGKVAVLGMAHMAYSAAKQIVELQIQTADYQLDRYMNLHDDYIGQRNLAVAQHYVNGAMSYANSMYNLALAGSAFGGPIGAIFGAALGFALQGAQYDHQNRIANDQQNLQLLQMDLQLSFTRSRAGWSTHAASIGEDL